MSMKKFLIVIVLLLSFSLVLAGCGGKSSGTGNVSSEKVFTKAELKKYNGQSGNPAYVAVDGVVYDVSSSPLWKDGKHNGYEAGNDLTQEIKKFSPHGTVVMKIFPKVGKLSN